MSFNVGDVATLTYTLTVGGTPTSATVVLTLTAPNGTSSAPTVTESPVGTYTAEPLVTMTGTWSYRFVASGTATDVETGSFTVVAAPFTSDPAEVSSRWRTLSAAEQTVTVNLLADAAAILLARVPTIPARVAAGTLDAALVKRVQAAMVKRVLSNPDGKRQEAIDDYSWTRDNAVSAGMLYATADEIAELSPQTRLRFGSIILGHR
jgi:hypothetical protein